MKWRHGPHLKTDMTTLTLPDTLPIPICHVQVLPILSGVQRVMLEIFKHLDRGQYAPHVICRDYGPLTDELQDLDIPYIVVPALNRPINPVKDFRALQELKAIFRDHKFDIVHTHSSKPGILARVAASQVGVPHIIHHVHSFAFHEFSSFRKRLVYSQLEKWAGRFCEKIVFVNNEERRMSIQAGWLPAEKCETVYNGVDLQKFAEIDCSQQRKSFRKAHGLNDDDLVILTLGRLEEPKQPLIFPEIAARLEELCPDRPWKILVAGSGSYENLLRLSIRKNNVGHRFKMTGWQTESFRSIVASDILLQPSLWEGLPVSVIEGNAAGLPTVASNVKGNREVVAPSTGYLCEPKNASSYAEALHELIENPMLRKSQGIAASVRAEEYFDGETNMKRIVNIYDELTGVQSTTQQLRDAA